MTRFRCCLSLLLASLALVARAQGASNTCVDCHTVLDDELVVPVRLMAQDIHGRQGLSCVDCHGGDAASDDQDAAMDPRKGFVARPAKQDVPRFCGRCHSDASFMRRYNPSLRVDQEALYHTSVHGQRLAGRGDLKVAVCTDCHGAHGILPGSDPRSPVFAGNVPQTCSRCHSDPAYMAGYGIPTDQLAKYSRSVHGRPLLEKGDAGAPACNDCHGNHGAAPPEVKSVAHVCGQCHPINDELVQQSPHRAAFERLGRAPCETCHGYHEIAAPGDEMVGGQAPAVCAGCHTPDRAPAGYEAARTIRTALDELTATHQAALQLVDQAERAGMEVGDARLNLSEALGRRTKARSALHSVDPAKVVTVTDEGMALARQAAQEGQAALEEREFRRRGLLASLVVIAVLGTALYLKIRTL